MARDTSDFYRGKRKKTGPAFLVSLIVLSLIALLILVFYGLQKFIVITNNGMYLDIPLLSEHREGTPDDDIAIGNFETVDAELSIGEPDYGNVKATAGEGLSRIRCVFVPYDSISESGIIAYANEAGSGGTVMLELKTVSGKLAWSSKAETAIGYGTSGELDLQPIISSLHEQNIGVAVRLCCLADDTLASRYSQISLHRKDGSVYSDTNGKWLDPTSGVVRRYIADLCRELSSMGVDEILLSTLRLPDTGDEFAYMSTSSVTQTPETAISGFAIALSRSLKDIHANVSIQVYSDTAMHGVDAASGQNAGLFLKVFPRIYRSSDKNAAATDLQTVTGLISVGEAKYRYVPMCYDGAPDTECWVRMS